MPRHSRSDVVVPLAISLLFHCAGVATFRHVSSVRVLGSGETVELIEVDVLSAPGVSVESTSQEMRSRIPPLVLPLPIAGDTAPARPDNGAGGAGKGGEGPAHNSAAKLADESVARRTHNTLRESQLHRLRNAAQRRSREMRRATPNPMELTFLVTGEGAERQRRVQSKNSSTGLEQLRPSRALVPGGVLSGDQGQSHAARFAPSRSAHERPTAEATPGTAIGVVLSARRKVASVRARPDIALGPAAIDATRRGRPQDRVDRSHAVANRVASLINASRAGGAEENGTGPANGDRDGSGGVLTGTRTNSVRGPGQARDASPASEVNRYAVYLRNKLAPHIDAAFPPEAKARGQAGICVLRFTVGATGVIRSVAVLRPSGVPGYDRELVRRVLATTLGPPPTSDFAMTMRFDAVNAAVPIR